MKMKNFDARTVASFGDEWKRFDHQHMSAAQLEKVFDDYFHLFPWGELPPEPVGFDMGCGSGRWASFVVPRVGKLYCVDPSEAIEVAKARFQAEPKVVCVQGSANDNPLPTGSMDFGYSLGVLHHVPDTQSALSACANLLKPGAPFLVYLYYALDGRPWWFRLIWKLSDLVRRFICLLPHVIRSWVTDSIACLVYWPLSRLARLVERMGLSPHSIPLAYYRNLSFYVLRTDARDRFGTPLEKRFTRQEIQGMLLTSGFEDVVF